MILHPWESPLTTRVSIVTNSKDNGQPKHHLILTMKTFHSENRNSYFVKFLYEKFLYLNLKHNP